MNPAALLAYTADENLVVSMAKEAGIKKIYKSIINSKNELDAVPIQL